jgi:hypothetical protein
MSNKDSEAFEVWYAAYAVDNEREAVGFDLQISGIARVAWQAAREHYSPTLPPLKDVELVAAAQAYGCGTADHLQRLAVVKALEAIGAFNAPKLTFEEAIEKAGNAVEKLVSRGRFPGDSEFDYALEMSAAAFRAAGVKFRDEA